MLNKQHSSSTQQSQQQQKRPESCRKRNRLLDGYFLSHVLLLVLIIIGAPLNSTLGQEVIDPGREGSGGNPTAPLPSGGTFVLGADPLRSFRVAAGAAQVTVTEMPVSDQTFNYALRVETKARTNNEANITLTAPSAVSVATGDVLFMRFYARTITTAASDGRGRVRLSTPASFSNPSFVGTVDEGWKAAVIPVPARLAYAAGALTVTINVGGTEPQVVEIGGLEFVNFGRLYLPHQLPFRLGDYDGRAPDALWRAQAQERIERFRKSDLRVVVVDQNGTPIPDAVLRVQMKRHDYKFGTAISGNALFPTTVTDNTLKYRDNLARLFNAGGPENDLKWRGGWENVANRQRAINTVKWLDERGMQARGHVLLWPSWNNSPASLKVEYDATLAAQGAAAANEQLRQRILDHVREEAGHPELKGRISEWDVVNETNANNDFQRILGKEILLETFRAAHEADPNALLYLNENSVETPTSSKTNFYFNEIKYLLDNNAPLGGIGLQGHIGAISIPAYLENLDRYATLGLPIKITEFDITTPDEKLQADITRDFLLATFSHPATVGFQMWGFWDGAHWLSDAPLFYRGTTIDPSFNWVLKPSGQAYQDLLFKEWWTDVKGQTDSDGTFTTRGFLGDYEVIVEAHEQLQTANITLPNTGNVAIIQFNNVTLP